VHADHCAIDELRWPIDCSIVELLVEVGDPRRFTEGPVKQSIGEALRTRWCPCG
jgi:hypothetical protein